MLAQGQVEVFQPMQKCSGTGLVNKEKSLSVKIPAGVDEGTRIRISGEGEAGRNSGPSGDLYIYINMITTVFLIGKANIFF